jgi:hypothetical protein
VLLFSIRRIKMIQKQAEGRAPSDSQPIDEEDEEEENDEREEEVEPEV